MVHHASHSAHSGVTATAHGGFSKKEPLEAPQATDPEMFTPEMLNTTSQQNAPSIWASGASARTLSLCSPRWQDHPAAPVLLNVMKSISLVQPRAGWLENVEQMGHPSCPSSTTSSWKATIPAETVVEQCLSFSSVLLEVSGFLTVVEIGLLSAQSTFWSVQSSCKLRRCSRGWCVSSQGIVKPSC